MFQSVHCPSSTGGLRVCSSAGLSPSALKNVEVDRPLKSADDVILDFALVKYGPELEKHAFLKTTKINPPESCPVEKCTAVFKTQHTRIKHIIWSHSMFKVLYYGPNPSCDHSFPTEASVVNHLHDDSDHGHGRTIFKAQNLCQEMIFVKLGSSKTYYPPGLVFGSVPNPKVLKGQDITTRLKSATRRKESTNYYLMRLRV